MPVKINIKNMVCPRCISAVEHVFNDVNIPTDSIKLGEVITSQCINQNQKIELANRLKAEGFELLEDKETQLVTQIKSLIITQIHHQNTNQKVNYSTLLSDRLNKEYSTLSKLFSSVEGITIERYILKQKIERVKELLFYNQFSLSEIADQLQYSSVAHLSSQFKRETGMTPTAFKNMKKPGHESLDF